ncbi:hypothetical protein NQ314_006123 [Rhamnusium bicolor]|uniref:Protein sleepless n=1 Tax=Rhamnusium bicolor TaxID=1586634 RepID=A0AAV8Z7E0_9CUCU|nr:hypothetical protein NQ314_006123 [Rhamnusium bicolor]
MIFNLKFTCVTLTSLVVFFILIQEVNGVWKYIRSCAYLGEPGIQDDERFCLMRTGTYNIFMEYCTCNTKDGCNTSSSLRISKILILSSIVGLVILKVMR